MLLGGADDTMIGVLGSSCRGIGGRICRAQPLGLQVSRAALAHVGRTGSEKYLSSTFGQLATLTENRIPCIVPPGGISIRYAECPTGLSF